jgi:type I restriction-modification system DNA methylase subunit
MADTRLQVQSALKALTTKDTKQAATELFGALGYASRKTVDLDGAPSSFLKFVDPAGSLSSKAPAQTDKWQRVDFLFQLTNDEIPILAQGSRDLFQSQQDYRTSIIESFVFLAIELKGEEWARGGLAGITREINRLFPMPVLILFKHGALCSLAVIDRRPNKKDGSRDVIEKRISIVKDINFTAPHRAHVDILCDVALSEVKVRGRGTPTNFRDLYDAWIEALSAQTLNTRFYRELAYWFFWSVKQVTFPATAIEKVTKKREEQNQIAVIRLLTRLIFVWFIKEKGLVPEALFEPAELRKLLKEDVSSHRDSSNYYKAILQNLFFATLNTEMSEDRKWRTKASSGGLDGQYLIHTVYRYRDAFREADVALDLFRQVPFLNGGLFECLDRDVSARDLERNPDLKYRLVKEGSRNVIRIDGFSERPDNPLNVPNKIFFATKEKVDLNEEYDTKGKTYEADGVIELFSRYKFTVEENTPVEEEVALDPELLGKVFENLLASYNADTRTTARKKSGSFYTPREVVDYMVDEALVAYFERSLVTAPAGLDRHKSTTQMLDMAMPGDFDLASAPQPSGRKAAPTSEIEPRLRDLLSFKESGNPFANAETDVLIAAIDGLRALDPACGSGAFPMGLLQKLIHILHRLDPENLRWKAQNRRPLEQSLEAAHATVNPSDKEKRIEDAEAALAKLDRDFSDANKPDYARKLYLIDKCLFGVDIQPIAVQIAKLRFFISLVVSQKIDRSEDNANITALPNLETKLVAANSLVPIERAAQSDLFRNTKIAEKETELRAMNARYFSARTAKTKRARRDDIARLRDELADLLRSDRGLPEIDAKRMAAWDPFDQNAAAPFFDSEWMFGLSSQFDLVIGNPPYVRQEAIKELKPLLEKHYGGKDKNGNPLGAYSGTADLFVYFIQRGIELLNPEGAFAFITSNKWYRAKYGERLRSWISRQAKLRRIIDFGDAEVFEALAYPTIIIATRRTAPVREPSSEEMVRVMNWPAERNKSEVEGFSLLVDSMGFDMPQKTLATTGWQLEPQAERGVFESIRAAGRPLKEFVESRVYRGVTTGFNDAFVIDDATRGRLIAEHENSAEIIKPYLRGTDVERWRPEPKGLWLIFTRRGICIEDYPAIKKHLRRFRSKLEPKLPSWNEARDGNWPGRKAGSYKWYEIQDNVNYWREFENQKILSTKISFRPTFCADFGRFYPGNTAYCVRSGEWTNFLVVLLNSNVSEYYSRKVFASKQGGFYEVQPEGLEAFPVPPLNLVEAELLNKIDYASIAPHDPRLEQLLNGFIYELFFKNDLHTRGITLFEKAEAAGLSKLVGCKGGRLAKAANEFIDRVFTSSHPLYGMLFDLQALDVVRIIEGKE